MYKLAPNMQGLLEGPPSMHLSLNDWIVDTSLCNAQARDTAKPANHFQKFDLGQLVHIYKAYIYIYMIIRNNVRGSPKT